jgi:hypothetical protein
MVRAHETYASEMHTYEIHAHELYPYEMHVREMHAGKMFACEMHVHDMHAYEIYDHKGARPRDTRPLFSSSLAQTVVDLLRPEFQIRVFALVVGGPYCPPAPPHPPQS